MSKEAIAVDLDDVLVQTAPAAIAFYNQKWCTAVRPEDFYQSDYAAAWQAPDKETAIRRVHEYIGSEEHFLIAPDAEAVEAMRQLESNYLLYIVTGRPDFIEAATRRWLEQHFAGLFADIIFSNHFDDVKMRSKGEICQELGVKSLIDDHTDHIFSAAESGVHGVLFGEYAWNRADRLPPELPDNVTRCADWPAVLELFDARG